MVRKVVNAGFFRRTKGRARESWPKDHKVAVRPLKRPISAGCKFDNPCCRSGASREKAQRARLVLKVFWDKLLKKALREHLQ